ncbi:MAG TPA: hypothetical protein VN368_01475 [Candidatus Methylomirabilis sp.]|nr:hypothetical protein [Candidatus Methylomirabilis sp.]
MSKNNTVVLRMPGASNGKEKMVNAGVGFIDTVNLERGEKRTVVHFLPEQPLTKGKTIMVFPMRGRELPVELTGHTKVGERDPGFVLYNRDEPVGSAWLHKGSRTLFVVVKVNRDVVISENQPDKRMTLFPRFPKDSQAAPGV